MKQLADKRYQVVLEYCGYKEPRFVARFCGIWVGQSIDYDEAMAMLVAAKAARENLLKGDKK